MGEDLINSPGSIGTIDSSPEGFHPLYPPYGIGEKNPLGLLQVIGSRYFLPEGEPGLWQEVYQKLSHDACHAAFRQRGGIDLPVLAIEEVGDGAIGYPVPAIEDQAIA